MMPASATPCSLPAASRRSSARMVSVSRKVAAFFATSFTSASTATRPTLRVFCFVRDGVPRGHLVRLEQPVLFRRRAEPQPNVYHVRGLRPHVALVRLDGLDLVTRAGVRIELIHPQPILLFIAVDDVAVPAPVVRQRDHRELTFLLGCGDETVQPCLSGRD